MYIFKDAVGKSECEVKIAKWPYLKIVFKNEESPKTIHKFNQM